MPPNHGLLFAALQPPAGRTLLMTKVDETATYNAHAYPLFANRWQQDEAPFAPAEFHLEGIIPV